ncbi:MAG: hypothetical protein WD056_00615 [Gemmatimonadota bacterium]
MLLLAFVAVVEFGGRDGANAGSAPPPQGLGPAPNVDLSSMTPREAADNLFDRVMRAVANDNTTEANNFLPMAIAAYEMATPLDADGLFHLSLLQRAGGELDTALATARSGLEENPDHLLNLSGVAAISLQLGDTASAREYYTRMLDVWDREIAADRVEYTEHAPLLPLLREDADALLGGGTP